MKEFSYEFDASTLGKHHYILEENGNSGICSCGHYDYDIPRTLTECPNCGTKAIIPIRKKSYGEYTCDTTALQYISFNNTEFTLKTKKIYISIHFKTTIINNEPVFKIEKDSLKLKTEDYHDLHFYYTTNKKGKTTLKTDFYILGESHRFLASHCPSLSGVLFVANNKEIKTQLSKINIEQYCYYDVWKIYSYYKHGKDLLMKGYTGFKGAVSDLRAVNNLVIDNQIGPMFDEMIERYKFIHKEYDIIPYYQFKRMYGTSRYYYEDAKYEPDFIKFILSVDKEVLQRTRNPVNNDISELMKFFYELNYTPEEAAKILDMAMRQKVSLYEFSSSRLLQTVRILKECDIPIDKNVKDVRIFLAKFQIFRYFDTYVYYGTKHPFKNHDNYKIELMNYENKLKAFFNLFSKYRENFFMSMIEFLMEKKRHNLDIVSLYKQDEIIEDCLAVIDNNRDVQKIFYKDIIIEKEEIEEFLNNMNDQELDFAV